MTMAMADITIVVVPFPAQGHLNQLLHFAARLASATQFAVHYATSPSHILQAKARLQGWDSNSLQGIHFQDLETPSPFPAPPPDHNSVSKFPFHLIPAFHASLDLHPPLASLLRSLSPSCRRLVVVHDPLMPFASKEAASLPNGESYQLSCVPAHQSLIYTWNSSGASPQLQVKQEVLDVFLTKFDGILPDEFWGFMTRHDFNINETGTLYNSCRAIEGEFLDLLPETERYKGKKLFDVGPLNPVALKSSAETGRHECLDWLDKQPADSVVYVSFGTTTTFADEEIEQLAVGLKSCGQRFIWVLRDADRGDIFAADPRREQQRKLPAGVSDHVKGGLGIVVRGWAPQLEILAHPSTGAFVSHCGWNSCMESLSNGVPMICWPLHSDQPCNALMVTGYLKAGIMLRDWGRRQEVIRGEEIAEVIKRMMADDDEGGTEIRKRAKAIGEEAMLAMAEGGSSQKDLESFIAYVSR